VELEPREPEVAERVLDDFRRVAAHRVDRGKAPERPAAPVDELPDLLVFDEVAGRGRIVVREQNAAVDSVDPEDLDHPLHLGAAGLIIGLLVFAELAELLGLTQVLHEHRVVMRVNYHRSFLLSLQ